MSNLGLNVIANYVGRAWTSVLSLLFIPIYLKFMGIEAYGLVGFYMALSSVLGILDLGIGATMNRELARLSVKEGSEVEQRDLVRTLELIYWGIAIFAGGLVILLAPYIAHNWIKAQNISNGIVLKSVQFMSIAIALQFPMSLYQGGLMGLQRQILVNGILIFTGTLRSVGAVLVLWLISPTVQAFLAWQVVASIIGSGVFLIAMNNCLPKLIEHAQFRINILRNIWKYSAAISLNAIIGIVLTQLDKIMLSRMLTLKMFGYYSLASTVASVIWMIILPFNAAIFPRFVQLHETDDIIKQKELLWHSSQFMSVILLPIALILIVYSKQILLIWTGNPAVADNSYLIVSLLVVGTALNGIALIPAYAASAFGWPQLMMITNLCQAIVVVPTIILLVRSFGAIGAAISYVLLNSVFVFIMTPVFFRRYALGKYWDWLKTNVLLILFPLAAIIGVLNFLINLRNLNVTIGLLSLIFILLSSVAIFLAKDVRSYLLSYRFQSLAFK